MTDISDRWQPSEAQIRATMDRLQRLADKEHHDPDHSHARTILALLDRRMPHPADVPDEVWQAANDTFYRFAYTVPGIQAAYRALYDHYNPPPKPQKVAARRRSRHGSRNDPHEGP